MNEQPVGFLDSGLGGISVLGEALRLLPHENYLYYGDTAHIPYGDKPPEQVLDLTHQAVDKLTALGCKAIVIACNTATSAAAGQLRQELQLPIIGMEPALKPASLLRREGPVLVLATQVTLALPKFQVLMEKYGKQAVPIPAPGLMECVEANALKGPRLDALLEKYLSPYREQPVKAVVLGCTHYWFLREAIAAYLPGVPLIDGNQGTIRQLRRRLEAEGLLGGETGGGRVEFLSSRPSPETLSQMEAMLALATKADALCQ